MCVESASGEYIHIAESIQYVDTCCVVLACVSLGPGPTGGEGQQVVSAPQPCPLPSPSVPTRSLEQTDGECVCMYVLCVIYSPWV